jgi:hypothetical protein
MQMIRVRKIKLFILTIFSLSIFSLCAHADGADHSGAGNALLDHEINKQLVKASVDLLREQLFSENRDKI